MGTREKIVAAAAQVMRDKGLARTTTKEIARAAGYSEGTLYKHFASKEDLFLAVLAERLPSLLDILAHLPGRVGQGTVRANLEEVATVALAFFAETVPIVASVLAEPTLLASHAAALRKQGGSGPNTPNLALAAYLHAEQALGRVRGDIDPDAAAAMLFGACFQRVFIHLFYQAEAEPAAEQRFAADVVHGLVAGLEPDRDASPPGVFSG